MEHVVIAITAGPCRALAGLLSSRLRLSSGQAGRMGRFCLLHTALHTAHYIVQSRQAQNAVPLVHKPLEDARVCQPMTAKSYQDGGPGCGQPIGGARAPDNLRGASSQASAVTCPDTLNLDFRLGTWRH
jgi:hypothetical protein